MKTVNVQEAKTHLSRLLEETVAGEEIVIAKAGKPMARLVPYISDHEPRKFGAWAGKVRIADDFDELPDEVLNLFEGKNQ